MKINALYILLLAFLSTGAWAQSPEKPFFDGAVDSASRVTMSRTDTAIEKYRKGDFTLVLTDKKGRPVNGSVEVELARHAFNFGVSMYGVSALPEGPLKEKALQAVRDVFNMVTVCEYWRAPSNKRNTDRPEEDLAFAKANNIRPRFHAIAYNNPRWIMGSNPTEEECWKMLEDRVRSVAERHAGRFEEFDVINEFVSGHHWGNHLDFYEAVPQFPQFRDPEVAKRMMAMTRRYLPDAKLVVLEAQVPSVKSPYFVETVDFWKSLVAIGGDFDYVGSQAHFYGGGCDYREGTKRFPDGRDAFTMAEVEKGLDLLGSIGKPVVITEFNGPSRNSNSSPKERARIWSLSDEENAAWQINFYRLAFSKPYIREVTRWFLVDELGGKGMDTGLLTVDGRKHAVYDALRRLIHEEWHTKTGGDVRNGEFAFRGFYGDYTVRVKGYKPATATLDKNGKMAVVLEK